MPQLVERHVLPFPPVEGNHKLVIVASIRRSSMLSFRHVGDDEAINNGGFRQLCWRRKENR